MTMAGPLAMAAVFALICVARATGQTKDPTNSGAAPPKLVMLVYQRFSSNKTAESGKALAAAARVCANLDVPNWCIGMGWVTGAQEELLLDLLYSCAIIGTCFYLCTCL